MLFSPSYTGKPKHQMPSRRYDLFIKQLEKATARQREEFLALSAMEFPYNICREVLESFNFQNEVRLALNTSGVRISIKMLYDDRWETFDQLIQKLGSELKSRDNFGEYSGGFNHLNLEQSFSWTKIHTSGTYKRISLQIEFPTTGTREYAINKTIKTIEIPARVDSYESIHIVPRENCEVEQSGSSSGS